MRVADYVSSFKESKDMETLVTAVIAIPFILCILTIKPENLKGGQKK